MKNADMPAMPQSATHDGYGCNYSGYDGSGVPTGFTKREMMAMNAPEIPDWFIVVWRSRNNIQPGCSVSSASMIRIYFEWRVYFAEQLLMELDLTGGESK